MKAKITTLFFLFFSAVCSAQALQEVDIMSGGILRKFWIKFPADVQDLDEHLPLIITLHGDGGTGPGIAASSGISDLAPTYNFIGVFPNAAAGGWNRAVLGDSPADDLQFMSDIIDHMCESYSINRNRVYIAGHSAGGFLAYRMAIEMADKIAAIAPVAANLYGDAANNGNAYITNYLGSADFIKLPILHIHGDNDNTVAYPDPNHQPDAWNEYPLTGFSYPTCEETTYQIGNITDINASVRKIMFCPNSADSKEISLIRIVGGGHGWPSAQLPDVADMIIQFFYDYALEQYPLCGGLNVEMADAESVLIYPNPVKDFLKIQLPEKVFSLQLYGADGRLVREFSSSETLLDLQDVKAGVYFLNVEFTSGRITQKIIKQ